MEIMWKIPNLALQTLVVAVALRLPELEAAEALVLLFYEQLILLLS
jgi:hypothetical protein